MSEAFLKVVNMSISAGWLVLAVLALRLVLKKAPKWVNVLLWGIVAVRLICPFSIESALSLIPSRETISPEIMMDWTPEISTGIAPLDQAVNPVISTSFAPHPGASANPLQILIPVAANLWLLGVIIMLAYTVISYLMLLHKLRTAVILRGNIFQCETVSSPFVLGILKPRIYLPYTMDGTNLGHVVAHEQAHIRRLDHWWKPLGFLLLTVYWFNPLMWVAHILLCRDIELACDEKVIAELGNEQRADYTQALVACAVNRRMIAACPLAFGEVGVKDRVKSILNYRKPTFWIIVTALAVCVVVAVCFLTDPNPSREFSMNGNNVSGLDPEAIVERIMDIEDIDNSNVYVNTSNFPIQVDSDFNWANSQTVTYFFWKNGKSQSSQLRIYPEEDQYFLTEPDEWPEQQEIFLLRHYLDAIKYLPQYEIQQMAPADQYIIQHVANGRPSDYARVITYSSDGVQETTGWFIHLQIQPLHADGEGYSGSGDEVIELFYGDSNGKYSAYAEMWFDFTAAPEKMEWTEEMKCTIEEFSGITFKYTGDQIIATTSWEDSDTAGRQILISGMPIWNAYFSDLTGDGLPEICSQVSYGSGMIDNRVIIFDYANGVSYKLEDRGYHDYYLRMNDADGYLYVDKRVYNSDELVSSGRLVFKDGSIQIEGTDIDPVSLLCATILEVHDGYFVVEPVEGSWELSIADKIEVPIRNMSPSPEPQVGDILQIEYDGEIQETYPARINNVYHIALQQTHHYSLTMIPTDTDLQGMHAGALLVPIAGNIYRYLLTDDETEGLTADQLLYTFTEETQIEGIVWEVYSIKEYPDRSAVLMISGTNVEWLCRYSPPGRCSDGALEDAIAANCVIVEDGIGTQGREKWQEFYNLSQQGKMASVAVAHYLTLDPNRCTREYYEIFSQDFPMLTIYQLAYNGNIYTISSWDRDGDAVQYKKYEYLMKFDTSDFYSKSSITPEGRYDYVLTHDNRVTWDQLWNGLVSSQAGAYIDHYSIYAEGKQ